MKTRPLMSWTGGTVRTIVAGRLDGPGEPDRTPRSQRGAARADRRARRRNYARGGSR